MKLLGNGLRLNLYLRKMAALWDSVWAVYYYYRYSALGWVRAETRALVCLWYAASWVNS
jgi:hypothetical protein